MGNGRRNNGSRGNSIKVSVGPKESQAPAADESGLRIQRCMRTSRRAALRACLAQATWSITRQPRPSWLRWNGLLG